MIPDWFILLALLIVGIIIIVFIAKILFFFLPAAIGAILVWVLTSNLEWAGIAFVAIAAFSLLRRIFK
ncbi:hypothetical protein KAI12_01685 [Candidatus Bathyarchaeota archaeon]|nr:hypothetical protein [Candidatus Bathyarchaeota archaeon]